MSDIFSAFVKLEVAVSSSSSSMDYSFWDAFMVESMNLLNQLQHREGVAEVTHPLSAYLVF